ncbi:MAG: tetratricopeptide repeat protein [Oligoflexia bacterium]|nr:tetratricopeptide repeat protein [Oligoflexia bacterium]
MSSQHKKWIVRNHDGHIYGPFEPAKIRELLLKGVFSGEEQVANYPAGDWMAMSAEAELYEFVLEAIGNRSPKVSPADKKEEKTMGSQATGSSGTYKIIAGETKSRKLKPDSAQKPEVEREPASHTQFTHTRPLREGDPVPKPPTATQIIEMKERKKIKKKSLSIVPLLLILVAGGLLYYAFTINQKGSRQPAISLMVPNPTGKGGPAAAENFYQKGLVFFLKDTFSNYRKAEEAFVVAIEAQPTHKEALLSLLMTQAELWPFTRQDNVETQTVQGVLQLMAQAESYGNHHGVALSIVDMILGRSVGAQTQIDNLLAKLPEEGRLYGLRATLFMQNQDYQQAIAYFEKAAALLPSWVKPYYLAGLAHSRLGDGASAQKFLIQALKINPNHAAARVELGVVEHKYFGNDDRALEYLNAGLDGNERLLPQVESRGRYILASILLKDGNAKESRRQAEIALKVNPSDPDVRDFLQRFGAQVDQATPAGDERTYMLMGEQYAQSRNHLAAQAQFRAAFDANPKNSRAALRAGESLWALHQPSNAFEYLQKAIVADPKFMAPYVILAQYRAERFDFDGAVKSLEQALKVNPKSYEVYRGYADIYIRRGDAAAAEVYAQRAFQLYGTDSKLNDVMAKIQLMKRDVVKALQFSKRAIELDSGNSEAQVTYAKAKTAFEGVKSGSEYLSGLIQKFPTNLTYRVGLGEILIQDEQYSQAETVLSQVVAADQGHKEALLLLGDSQLFQNQIDAALKSYLGASKADPSDPAGLFRAGELYLKADKPSDALRYFKLVIQTNGLYPRVRYNLARANFSLGLGDEALKELEEEKKLNPKLADPYEFAGDILMASRKFSLATKEYQKVIEIRPVGAEIYVKIAKAYRAQGSVDAAASMLRIAVAKESGYPEIYKEQGELFEIKGQAKEAAESYRQYLRLNPSPPDKDRIQNKIKELD